MILSIEIEGVLKNFFTLLRRAENGGYHLVVVMLVMNPTFGMELFLFVHTTVLYLMIVIFNFFVFSYRYW
jgi:hypothetical protein